MGGQAARAALHTSDDHRLAVELRFFTPMVQRTTYGADGHSVVATTDSSLVAASTKRVDAALVETQLPADGAYTVWQSGGDWQSAPEDVTFFTLSHRGLQGGTLLPYTVTRRYDVTTSKSNEQMKKALYEESVGGATQFDESMKTVWNTGAFYFNKFFDGLSLEQTATVYHIAVVSTAVNATTMKMVGVSMGVGPYVNPYQQLSVPPSSVSATCADGVRNEGETSIECGGPRCAACVSCTNGIQDQGELLTDCGGPNCAQCDPSLLLANSTQSPVESTEVREAGISRVVIIIVLIVVILLCLLLLCAVFFLRWQQLRVSNMAAATVLTRSAPHSRSASRSVPVDRASMVADGSSGRDDSRSPRSSYRATCSRRSRVMSRAERNEVYGKLGMKISTDSDNKIEGA